GHTIFSRDWRSDVCSSDLGGPVAVADAGARDVRRVVGQHAVLEFLGDLDLAPVQPPVVDEQRGAAGELVDHGAVELAEAGPVGLERKNAVQGGSVEVSGAE